MKRILCLTTVVGAAVVLAGCDLGSMVDSKVEERIHEYFPRAEVAHPPVSPGPGNMKTLIILTHVNNVSEKFASQVMRQLLRDYGQDLKMGMTLANYLALTVDFEEGRCVWIRDATAFACGAKGAGEMNNYPVYEPADLGNLMTSPVSLPPVRVYRPKK